MSKFIALFKNELIKIFRRKALIVTFTISILLIVAIGLIAYALQDVQRKERLDSTPQEVHRYIEQLSYGENEKIPELQSKLTSIVDGYEEKYGDKVNYTLLLNDIGDYAMSYLGLAEDDGTLTEDKCDYLINKAAITEYKLTQREVEYLDKNNGDSINNEMSQVMIYIAFYITIMYVMILGGGSVANEMASGTIKSLIIAPVKRSKIFFAKITSVVAVGIVMYILQYIFICIFCGLLFGFDDTFFIFTNGAKVFSMSFYLKNFLFVLISSLTLTAYASLAFMMSCVTKNTASAVGASMGIFYAGGIVMSILEMFINPLYIKLTPLHHLSALSSLGSLSGADVFDKLFKYTQYSSYNFYRSSTDFSACFSALYVVIFTFLMLWIAYDSFTKKDI